MLLTSLNAFHATRRRSIAMANNKYMVSVEAETNLSAEHKILDEIYDGMQSALSFDKDTMKTDHFRACLMDCETISFSELMEMSKAYREQWAKVCEYKNDVEAAETMVEDLEKRLAEAKELLRKANQRLREAELTARTNMDLLGMRRD